MNNNELDLTNAEILRKKAEDLLKKREKKNHKPDLEKDTKKLLHELQVHQIELEMQNEELRKAYETTEAALKKYTMLYDLAPMGYFTIDFDGSICDLNFTGADLLGDRRISLLNSNFKLFVAEDSLPLFNTFLSTVFTSNDKESCEVTLSHEHTHSKVLYMEGIVTVDDHKCLLSVIDISAFKK